MYPADLKYTKDHEWVRLSGSEARVGITDYAQKQLGDVVYVVFSGSGIGAKVGATRSADVAASAVRSMK